MTVEKLSAGETSWRLQMDQEECAGQKWRCQAWRNNGGGQRTRARAAEAWPGTLSPSCHLAQNEGSGLHHAGLAQKSRTGEGFIHPPTSSIQLTDLRQVDAAAVLVFLKEKWVHLSSWENNLPSRWFVLMYNWAIIFFLIYLNLNSLRSDC